MVVLTAPRGRLRACNVFTAGRLLCGAVLLLALTPACAAPTEYEIKAAFIAQMARFVEWPPSDAPLRLCVLGGNPFGTVLESLRGDAVNARRLEVLVPDIGANIRECSMLFVAGQAENHLERIAALARGTGVLTIGDTPGFGLRGVMINFFPENGKIRFEINLAAVRQSGLKVSSRLLSLGRIVGTDVGN